MSIECYESKCKFHSCHDGADVGPICDERECHVIGFIHPSNVGKPCVLTATRVTEDQIPVIRADRHANEPLPRITAMFETVGETFSATTGANIKRVERQDDGTYTVVLDHWPKREPGEVT